MEHLCTECRTSDVSSCWMMGVIDCHVTFQHIIVFPRCLHPIHLLDDESYEVDPEVNLWCISAVGSKSIEMFVDTLNRKSSLCSMYGSCNLGTKWVSPATESWLHVIICWYNNCWGVYVLHLWKEDMRNVTVLKQVGLPAWQQAPTSTSLASSQL